MVRIRKFHFLLFLPLIICVMICFMGFYLLSYGALPLVNYRLHTASVANTDLRYKIEDLEFRNQDLREELAALEKIEKGYLPAENNLDANLLFREHFEKTAAGSGVLCRNIGNIKTTPLVHDVISLELSFVIEGKTVQTMDFLQKLNQGKPVVYWKNLSIRSDSKETLTLTGIVCVLCKIQEEPVQTADRWVDPVKNTVCCFRLNRGIFASGNEEGQI